jgi:hypothetical protein
MSFDISHLLDEWEYEPGQIVVRKFKTRAGVEKLQLRLDLGLLQMNLEGRPDGKRPYGRDSLLSHFESRLKRYAKLHEGDASGFKLNAEDCSKLQQEAIQFHHRYICLFQLQDYACVIRDTERNLRAFEFLRNHSAAYDLHWPLHHLIPQLILIQTRAKGMLAIDGDQYLEAIEAIEEGLDYLREFYQQQSRPDLIDQSGEIQSLEAYLHDIQSTRPLSRKEKLEQELEAAVRREDYERAAQLRDILKSPNPSNQP